MPTRCCCSIAPIEQARKTIEMDPHFAIAHYSLERALRRKRIDQEALQERLKGDELVALPAKDIEALKAAAARDGWRGYYTTRIEQLAGRQARMPQYYELGRVSSLLGRKDDAFAWFARGFEHGDARLVNIGVDCAEDLRHDPRFVEMQRKMALPDHGLRTFTQ